MRIMEGGHQELPLPVSDIAKVSSWHAVSDVNDPVVISRDIHLIFYLEVFIQDLYVTEKHMFIPFDLKNRIRLKRRLAAQIQLAHLLCLNRGRLPRAARAVTEPDSGQRKGDTRPPCSTTFASCPNERREQKANIQGGYRLWADGTFYGR